MKKHAFFVSTFVVNVILLLTSCKKEIINETTIQVNSAVAGNLMGKEKKIRVSTVEELYGAVNDPANAGSVIVISPGTYVLTANYPNGGRLELQTDMGLQGQPGQPGLVVIDQSSLPSSSYAGPTAITGGNSGWQGNQYHRMANAKRWFVELECICCRDYRLTVNGNEFSCFACSSY